MRIIIPMAGLGKRLRPHTFTTPKPLLPIAGKPIVQRLVEDIIKIYEDPIEEIAYVIGDFGKEVEHNLLSIAEKAGAKGTIYYQEQALGTAHAIWCAKNSISEGVIIAFADTLFRANFKLDQSKDGVIWVKSVEDPKNYGVVTLNEEGIIKELVEKPQKFVSDLAIIGIYYIRNSDLLLQKVQYLLDNDLRYKGEYQLTDALELMRKEGAKFVPGAVIDWMDCGNKELLLETNAKILTHLSKENQTASTSQIRESVIIPPCYIGENVQIEKSIIGPYVSVGNDSVVKNSVIKDSIVREAVTVEGAVLSDSMLGNNACFKKAFQEIDLGDYSNA